jgi:hypothetical protein
MHADPLHIDIDEVTRSTPIPLRVGKRPLLWGIVTLASLCILYGLFTDPKHLWNTYFITSVYFLGLCLGSVMITVIFQVVRATWGTPIRRICEANIAFLPYAYLMFLGTYFGKEYIFPWANAPMPGREYWMQPDFVYGRFAILLGLLVYLLYRFVQMSLRSDIGYLKQKAPKKDLWEGYPYDGVAANWQGMSEIKDLQRKMSFNGPIVIVAYAVIVSLFAFEMIMSQDTIWYSNMLGGFVFLGFLYMAWAMTSLWAMYFSSVSPVYKKTLGTQQFWDLGKLTFGFSMLWGYTMISQYLPQWYGNMPEETQWLYLRTKEFPWKPIAFLTLGMCFIFPFITLVSEDIKKTPKAFKYICFVVLAGMWVEKFILVSPQRYPTSIPFGWLDVAVFVGFAAAYFLMVTGFMSKYPCVPVSHPQASEDTDW